MRRHVLAAGAALMFSMIARAQADSPPPTLVAVGSKVRLHSTQVGGQLRGIVAAVDQKQLTLAREHGAPAIVPLNTLTSLDRVVGRKRKTLKGLAIGTGIGVLLGLVIPEDSEDPLCKVDGSNLCSRGEAMAIGMISGALWGTGIGALVKGDVWAPVALKPQQSAVVSGQRKSVFALVFRLRF
jgi:hypothetical protein